jgi:DNA ligase-1
MKPNSSFRQLADTLEKVRANSRKTEKVIVLAKYLSSLTAEDAELAARLVAGRVSKRGSRDEAQVGYSTILDSLREACGARHREVSESYLRHGDLGEVAEELLREKREMPLFPEQLTLKDLNEGFERLRSVRGKGSSAARRAVVKSFLVRASPLEGKYIVKALTGEMRTGAVQGLVEEAVARAFAVPRDVAAKAHMLVGDPGSLARAAAEGRLAGVRMEQFRPVNFMLAEPLSSPADVAARFEREVFAEFKYDGVRAQVHKLGSVVRIFSRRLEDITSSFPEVVNAAAPIAHDFVMDGEIVPFSQGRPLPFQLLQKRLRRKENLEEAAMKAPVLYFAFDLLLLDGKEVYTEPLVRRRRALDLLVRGSTIRMAQSGNVRTEVDVAALFRRSRDLGYEGLVVKDPASVYSMGRRGSGWVKLKEELDTIDAVIVAAEYGHGKRAGVISNYTFAVRDGENLRTIGKAYSGLTDREIEEMTQRLKGITLEDFGYRRTVRPEVVLEVAFDSVQRSGRHDSGYALRFPRIRRVRLDKSVADIDTLDKIAATFQRQKLKVDQLWTRKRFK